MLWFERNAIRLYPDSWIWRVEDIIPSNGWQYHISYSIPISYLIPREPPTNQPPRCIIITTAVTQLSTDSLKAMTRQPADDVCFAVEVRWFREFFWRRYILRTCVFCRKLTSLALSSSFRTFLYCRNFPLCIIIIIECHVLPDNNINETQSSSSSSSSS